MKPVVTHRFKVSPAEAARIQDRLRGRLVTGHPLDVERIGLVAAADVSYLRGDERVFAAVVVVTHPGMDIVEARTGSARVTFPYIPGLLAFRELPALTGVFRRLSSRPDVLLVDGHGVAHPRGFGIASHLGVLLGMPAVGVAKTVLVGEYETPEGRRGSRSPLVYRGGVVGLALRTREDVKPVFVSVGHLADLRTAADLVLACCRGYRLPEPIRRAHRLADDARGRAG